MLSLDDAAHYLLARRLIDPDWIIGGSLTIRNAARRNNNLLIEGPGEAGLLIKQPGDPAERSRETLGAEAAFYQFCHSEPAAARVAAIGPRLIDYDPHGPLLALGFVSEAETLSAFLKPKADQQSAIEVAGAIGVALATVHRTFRRAELWRMPAPGLAFTRGALGVGPPSAYPPAPLDPQPGQHRVDPHASDREGLGPGA